MSRVGVIGVRFDGYGRPGNQTDAAAALRRAGIMRAPDGLEMADLGDIAPPGQSGRRGPNGLINEPALEHVTRELVAAVRRVLDEGGFPLVVGGDCSALLGSLGGARRALGAIGLLHIDGHEDTTPIDSSEDGEAANSEIGMLLGLTGRAVHGVLAEGLPVLTAATLALVGQRDDAWRRALNLGSLETLGVWKRSSTAVAAAPEETARSAVTHLRVASERWWLHVDVDVMDPVEFPAQGLPDYPDEPGGLTRAQLSALVGTAAALGGCAGASIAIYDPDQDADGSGAAFVVDLAHRLLASLRP